MTPEGADHNRTVLSAWLTPQGIVPTSRERIQKTCHWTEGTAKRKREAKGPPGWRTEMCPPAGPAHSLGGGGASLGAGQGVLSLPRHRGILMSFLARSDELVGMV